MRPPPLALLPVLLALAATPGPLRATQQAGGRSQVKILPLSVDDWSTGHELPDVVRIFKLVIIIVSGSTGGSTCTRQNRA